jgi:homocitrate synthase NifV
MEIGFDELRWPDKAVGYGDCSKIRITGLDDGMNGDYPALFKSLKSQFSSELQFCPGNRLYAATALATEWAIQETDTRDSSVVTAFGGIGGLAATEEVIMALRLAGLRKADKEYPFFPEIAGLLERISQAPVRQDKAVIGKRIFTVESGIHVDGILKHPDCYEPFAPRIVGGKRQITLGKQSGRASVGAKLAEMGLGCNNAQILQILTKVKQAGYQKNGSVTESEFAGIVRDCLASGQRQAERL